MLALVDGQPRTLTLKQALRVYLEHRLEVIQPRSAFDLARAKERAHVLAGLIIALDNLDAVIKTIRKSRNSDTARKNLMSNFKVTEIQAQAILEMPLRRLASLEIRKIREEYKEKLKLIKSLEDLLASPLKQRRKIAEELETVREEYDDARRTIIAEGEATGLTLADFLVPEEKTVVMLSVKGDLGRTALDEAPRVTTTTKTPPRLLQHSTTAQVLYLFADDGCCATLPVQQIPPVAQASLGARFSDLSALNRGRRIASFLCLPVELEDGFISFATAGGLVKRLHISDLPGVMSREFRVMKLAKGDRIVDVLFSGGADQLVLTTARGYAIRFSEEDVRPTGLTSGGVRGMRLAVKGDRVVAADLAEDNQYMWTVTADGIAKASRMDEYKMQGRGGSGVISMRREEADPDVAAATVGSLDDDILVYTNKHKAKRVSLGLAKTMKRAGTGGSPVIVLREKERVIGLAAFRQRIEVADAPVETQFVPLADAAQTDDQMPRQYELSLEEIELLLDEADGVDGSSNGASSNGADPSASADE